MMDLLKGVILPFFVPGLVLLPLIPGLATPIGFGAWAVLLCATQRVWIPSFVRLVFLRRWTKIFLWPWSMGGEELATTFLQAIAWLWGAIGVFFILVALVQGD
jgi:hypothetical protein